MCQLKNSKKVECREWAFGEDGLTGSAQKRSNGSDGGTAEPRKEERERRVSY
ncbi:hypothetical protein [Listeria goaensis]|uniref:hypothetical protein n=1 Tax=Listeria goaensis TaxID=1649188 RepID=UPI00196768D8|nr:hypothetical protein [Listeria goaensis]